MEGFIEHVWDKRVAGGFLVASILALYPIDAAAQDESERKRSITLRVENDSYGYDSDRHYTQGHQLIYAFERPRGAVEDPDFLDKTDRALSQVGRFLTGPFADYGQKDNQTSTRLVLGQSIFTPEDIGRLIPDATDRPYAGWLYAGLGVEYRRPWRSDEGERPNFVIDNFELEIGVVGPQALSGEVQRWWHRMFDFQRPQGWGSQLGFEPGIVLAYERRWPGLFSTRSANEPHSALQIDLTPNIFGAGGNVYTHGGAGAMVRLGQRLDATAAVPRIRPGQSGAGFLSEAAGGGFYWFVFASALGRVVARNIFLDGNSFRSSPSVDKKHLVADAEFGLVLGWNRFELSLINVLRSKEFRGQDGVDEFGALNLTVRW